MKKWLSQDAYCGMENGNHLKKMMHATESKSILNQLNTFSLVNVWSNKLLQPPDLLTLVLNDQKTWPCNIQRFFTAVKNEKF